MFPSSCSCRLYDEVRRLSVPNSPLTWVCPCPLVSDRTIPAPAQDTFAMCTAEGVIMGRVEMSCCVVPVGGELDPSLTTDPAPNGGLIVTSPVQFNGPAGVIAVNGKRYVIRVLIDGYPGRSRKKKSSGVTVSSSGTAAIVNSKSEGPTEGAHGGHESHAGKGGTTDDTEKDCLLYSMQHNVVFQLQSICEVLRATLKRDFKALDSRSINKSQKDNAESLERSVKGIRKYSNVMLQLTVQLIESAGGTYKGSADCGGTGAISAEGFPLPRKGSLAQFLVNNVLSQLESLGACLYHVTKVHRQQLEVPMSVLEHQHVKCLRKLDCSIQDANKQVNILVQSSLCEDVHRKESSISSVSSQGSSLSMMTDQRSNSSNSRILSVYGGLPSTKRGSGHQSKSLREVTVPGVQSRIRVMMIVFFS
uniref:Uncharacterized protein n=1 Tax=Trypanosoma vivax (strain Y486) TaxID=1055687 RepID=G0U383_TRYVY|nr:conserved hypothetical protein, fragment [Trypanosoma vivax Y486]